MVFLYRNGLNIIGTYECLGQKFTLILVTSLKNFLVNYIYQILML